LLRWLGLLLVGLVATLWLSSLLFFQYDCDYDCGDQGGRGVFLFLTLTSPCGAFGAVLIVASLVRDVRAGRPPAPAWRLAIKGVRISLVLGTGVAALLTVAFFTVAFEGLLSPDFINSEPDYVTPAIYAVLAALWGGSAWFGRTAVRRTNRLLGDWPAGAG